MQPATIFLASASPRRRELLRGLGLRVEVCPSRLGEDGLPGESPRQRVRRLSTEKARRIAPVIRRAGGEGVILGADTEVILDGRVLGKPGGPREAAEMLRALSGRAHSVLTGVHLIRPDGGAEFTGAEESLVTFRPLEEDLIRWYVATGEPLDKAGAYGIQGRGVLLVERIEGSWSNVVGLPLERLPEWFRRLGLDLLACLEPKVPRNP